jgi:hypothetical protein
MARDSCIGAGVLGFACTGAGFIAPRAIEAGGAGGGDIADSIGSGFKFI